MSAESSYATEAKVESDDTCRRYVDASVTAPQEKVGLVTKLLAPAVGAESRGTAGMATMVVNFQVVDQPPAPAAFCPFTLQ